MRFIDFVITRWGVGCNLFDFAGGGHDIDQTVAALVGGIFRAAYLSGSVSLARVPCVPRTFGSCGVFRVFCVFAVTHRHGNVCCAHVLRPFRTPKYLPILISSNLSPKTGFQF